MHQRKSFLCCYCQTTVCLLVYTLVILSIDFELQNRVGKVGKGCISSRRRNEVPVRYLFPVEMVYDVTV